MSLALGVGANTAIFTLMEAVLWKSIPVEDPDQLPLLSWVSGPKNVVDSTWGGRQLTPGGVGSTVFSYAVFQALQQTPAGTQSVFAFKPSGPMTAVIDGHAELVTSESVSGSFYASVGVVPIAGRPITPTDDKRTGAGVVAVISDSFWSRRFGRDVSVLGRTIRLNQVPVTVVGIHPPSFKGMEPGRNSDIFLPLSAQPVILPFQWAMNQSGSLLDDSETWWLQVMVRLKPEMNESQIQAALDVILKQAVRDSYPNKKNYDMPRLKLLTGSRGLDGLQQQFRKPVFVLLSLVGLVLLIACANLANLLLARATARQREISVRLALGAGRWRIIRQMVTEGLVLAVLGGSAGVLLGFWLRNGIPRLLASQRWRALDHGCPEPARWQVSSCFSDLPLAVATSGRWPLYPNIGKTQIR